MVKPLPMTLRWRYIKPLLLISLFLGAVQPVFASDCKDTLVGTEQAQGQTQETQNVLRIEIKGTLGTVQNQSTGSKTPFRMTQVAFNGVRWWIHEAPPPQTVRPTSMEIVLIGDGVSDVKVSLPEAMAAQLLKYILKGPSETPFDCNCFAHHMNGLKFTFGNFIEAQWILQPFLGESFLKPGDTIVLGFGLDALNHFAVYLGHGLYLSKYGVIGPVLVASLAAMEEGYGAPALWVVSPKIR